MPKLSPAAQQARRLRILEAAATCFERDGFHATTIPDICREAGVSTGAVYTWYPSKGAIVAALADVAHERRRALLAQWSTPAELASGLVSLANWLRGSSAARLDVHLWSGALTDDTLRDSARASFEQSIAGMAEILGDGDDRRASARGRAGLLLAAVVGVEVLGAIDAPDVDDTIAALDWLLETVAAARPRSDGDPSADTADAHTREDPP